MCPHPPVCLHTLLPLHTGGRPEGRGAGGQPRHPCRAHRLQGGWRAGVGLGGSDHAIVRLHRCALPPGDAPAVLHCCMHGMTTAMHCCMHEPVGSMALPLRFTRCSLSLLQVAYGLNEEQMRRWGLYISRPLGPEESINLFSGGPAQRDATGVGSQARVPWGELRPVPRWAGAEGCICSCKVRQTGGQSCTPKGAGEVHRWVGRAAALFIHTPGF